MCRPSAVSAEHNQAPTLIAFTTSFVYSPSSCDKFFVTVEPMSRYWSHLHPASPPCSHRRKHSHVDAWRAATQCIFKTTRSTTASAETSNPSPQLHVPICGYSSVNGDW